jgi:3-oxoacyl-[acyl-carrier-protein] synthase III
MNVSGSAVDDARAMAAGAILALDDGIDLPPRSVLSDTRPRRGLAKSTALLRLLEPRFSPSMEEYSGRHRSVIVDARVSRENIARPRTLCGRAPVGLAFLRCCPAPSKLVIRTPNEGGTQRRSKPWTRVAQSMQNSSSASPEVKDVANESTRRGHLEAPFRDVDSAEKFIRLTGIDTFADAGSATAEDILAPSLFDLRLSKSEFIQRLGYIIYCTASIREELDAYPAFRIQHTLGAPKAIPFAIGQLDAASPYEALGLAQDLVSSGMTTDVLIVTAEQYLLPLPRRFGDLTIVGDGAGWLWLSTAGAHDWAVVDSVTGRFSQFFDPYGDCDRELFVQQTVECLGRLIENILSRQNLALEELTYVVPPGFSPQLTVQVHRALGIREGQDIGRGPDPGNLGTVDIVFALNRLMGLPKRTASTSLIWGVGLSGAVGCALVKRI